MTVRLLLATFDDPSIAGRAAETWAHYAKAATKNGDPLEDVALQVRTLPASHDQATETALKALGAEDFDYFLLVGTDPTSSDYKLHVLTVNYADDPRPDAQGKTLKDTILDPDGPVAYRTRLPLDGIWDKFMVERVPVRMSHKAGVGVFNHVLYDVMRALEKKGSSTRCGAIELPPLVGEQADDIEGREKDELEEELHMVLAVLEQLFPVMEADEREDGAPAHTAQKGR